MADELFDFPLVVDERLPDGVVVAVTGEMTVVDLRRGVTEVHHWSAEETKRKFALARQIAESRGAD